MKRIGQRPGLRPDKPGYAPGPIFFAAALLAVHEAGKRALDALGVADQLLAGGASSLGLAAVLVGFLVVRLLLWFVAPGVVIAAIVLSLPGRRRLG